MNTNSLPTGKLRESMLKTTPDDFSKAVFLFSIRISTRVGHYQTYIPSITYLLDNSSILNNSEFNEVVQLYILHISHFTRDNRLALELFEKHCPDNVRLSQILKGWRSRDYLSWFKLYHGEKDTGYKQVMKFGLEKMITQAMKIITKSYFQLPKVYIEDNIFKFKFDILQAEFGCKWQDKGEVVVIRERT